MDPLRKYTQPTPFGESLDHLAATMGLGSVDGIRKLFLAWPDVVGADLATHCEPKRIDAGVLTISAADRQWATELSWMTELIAQRCCDALGEGSVTEVIVRVSKP